MGTSIPNERSVDGPDCAGEDDYFSGVWRVSKARNSASGFTARRARHGALAHPGIVPVFDVGEHEGTPFLVMEFVTGPTLTDMAKTNGQAKSGPCLLNWAIGGRGAWARAS